MHQLTTLLLSRAAFPAPIVCLAKGPSGIRLIFPGNARLTLATPAAAQRCLSSTPTVPPPSLPNTKPDAEPGGSKPAMSVDAPASADGPSEDAVAEKKESKENLKHAVDHARVTIVLRDQDLEEKYVKGSGPGGQKINKRANCVQLVHIPTGVRAESQRFRDLTSNRKEARKLLTLKLDDLFNGSLSKRGVKQAKEQKRKKKQAQRTGKKKREKEDVAAAGALAGLEDNAGETADVVGEVDEDNDEDDERRNNEEREGAAGIQKSQEADDKRGRR
ncbi:hypothetical protein HK101_003167 [Irineochytrium annulatum]|nr:hypothetical protein HK101_003167 [Irineochytrium annulatum]